jgi:LCP family protein required for cell wall assembly
MTNRTKLSIGGLVAVAVVAASASLWVTRQSDGSTGSGRDEAASSPSEAPASPEAERFELVVDLFNVRAVGVNGKIPPAPLADAAEAIRRTMTGLYSVGFVDPEMWGDGRFPALDDFFAGHARRRVQKDLGDVSLGAAARAFTAVRPGIARLNVRFVVDRNAVPVVAVASMEFTATGIADGVGVSLRHEGHYTLRRVGGRWRIVAYDVRGRVPSPGVIGRKVHEAAASPTLASRGLLFVLVIGSDARPGQSATTARADSIHIVGVNPAKDGASILGIPRDTFVQIPGVGTRKINEALVRGGPPLVVETVERLTGITMDAYVLTGFDGFAELVTAVGGIDVEIPYPMHDPFSNADFPKGHRWLSGREALQFSRDRHDTPGGDFGRSLNQGRLLLAAAQEFREDLREDPLAVLRWITSGGRYLRTDLSLAEMTELVLAVPSVDPRRVENRVVSGHGASVGGLSVVFLDAGARAMFRDVRTDALFGRHPFW